MKKIWKTFVYTFIGMPFIIFASLCANAQDALKDTLPESAYNLQIPKHVVNIYSNFVPYVLFSIILLAMSYIGYRYWADNRPDHDGYSHHRLEH